MENTVRPQTPENHVVEEDMITPVQNKRGNLESSLKVFSNSDTSVTPTPSTASYRENVKDTSSDSSDADKSDTKGPNTTIGSVDFNLNMTSDPTLFSTPYPSRNTKEASSGMSYDISMMELNDIENKLQKEPKEIGKGGISFEIRDDVVSGGTLLTSVSKTVSNSEYHVSRTRSYQDVGETEKIKLQRPASFKEDYSTSGSNMENDNTLDWSGKRLVRAGSFSEIAQDAEQDWVDHNRIDKDENEDSSIGNNRDLNSSEESLEQSERKGLSKPTMFRARENLANLSSENSDSLQSITSSSRGSTPPPPYTANGNEDQGLGTSPESSPIKVPLNINDLNTSGLIDVIPTDTSINTDNSVVTSTVESNSNFAVTVESSHGDEADC
ncbi:hypothetical protein FSP39_023164 [Pinctada imbricata]|uniref:Uncharacterized protein n=1 Tax=Pinctada imbricata TaxID=66713 RepID=A0AA89BXG6_PINIB|nr:hypothetical protein FSP39_023164 [Pinctada imbricata]